MRKLILTSLLILFCLTAFSQDSIVLLNNKTKTTILFKNTILSYNEATKACFSAVEMNTVKIKVSKKDKLQPKSTHYLKQLFGRNRKLIRIA